VTLLPAREPAFARSPWRALTGALETGRSKTVRTHVIALADQAVVSGASFVTFIMVSHWSSPSHLGVYSIGISVLLSALAVQHSMVLLPFIIDRYRPVGTLAEHVGTSLIQSGLLSALAIILSAGTALCLLVWDAGSDMTGIAWALAATVPFVMLREFARRCAFGRLHMGEALILDLAIAAIQFALLYWLGSTGRMSPTTACAALGVACALVGLVWLYLCRSDFVFRKDQTLAAAKQSWSLGKWLLAAQVTISLQGYAIYWLLALVQGAAATGVYAACMSLASVGNPLMMGINNALGPKTVLALDTGGAEGLRRQTVRGTALQGAAMSMFCLVLAFWSADAMRLVYHGKDFDGQGDTVALLGLGLLASALGSTAHFGLASIGGAQDVVRSYVIGLAVTVVFGLFLMGPLSLFGAAAGYVAGCVAATVGLWAAFLTRLRECSSRPDSRNAILAPTGPDSGHMSVVASEELITKRSTRLAQKTFGGRRS
jgi:O-antigen/teichoic acid export membrane protein